MTNSSTVRISIIFGLGVMAAMSVSEAVTVLSAIAQEFHPSNPSFIGLVMSLPSLVVAIGALMAGYLVDQTGDRPILLAGAVVLVMGDLCVIFSPSFNLLLASRLLSGIGYVLTAVASITILMRITSGKQRTMAIALWSTSVPVSFILPFLTAGLAVAVDTWRAAFAAHAAATTALLLLAIFSLPESDVSLQPSRTQGIRAVLRSPRPYLLGLSFASNAFLLSGITAALGPYLAHRYRIGELQVQYWNVFAMLMNVVGSLLVGRWLNRGVPAMTIGLSGIVLTVVSAALLFGMRLGLMGSIVDFWFFTFGSGLLVGMWALVPRCGPSSYSLGATSGLVTQLTLIGVLFGAPLVFAAQASATPAPMLILLLILLLACLAGGVPIWRSIPSIQISDSPNGRRPAKSNNKAKVRR